MCSTDNDVNKTRDLIQVFSQRQVDGYIITAPQGIENDLRSLIGNQVPLILFDRFFEDLDSDYVIIDNYQSTYRAIQHLIENRFKNIAFFTVASNQNQMHERLAGYEAAMTDSHLPLKVLKVNYELDNMVDDMKTHLKNNPEIDAVFFATNYLAIRGLEAINSLSLKIPDDIGVVAFDDHDIFRIYQPPITAVSQPIEEISQQLITILLKNLDSKSVKSETQKVVIPAKLIVRKSSFKAD